MRLVRLERQQSRVADDIRAALASLGRGSTVIGGIALVGVGSVTERPIEAVVVLPHGVIIVIGVDLPDPALRLEAPLGAPWKADGWPLVADDDAVNPATEALDMSQACERRIAELVPGTAPVGTIVAVGPYVETVDQPPADLAGPVRVLHPTPTTMLAATVSLATAHRPRSVDQVRALIRGLAPSAPEFSDEVLIGEGFSRLTDDAPPESLGDDGPPTGTAAISAAAISTTANSPTPDSAASASAASATGRRTESPVEAKPEPAAASAAEPAAEADPEPPAATEAALPPAGEEPSAEAETTEVLPSPAPDEPDRPVDPSTRPVFPGTEASTPETPAPPPIEPDPPPATPRPPLPSPAAAPASPTPQPSLPSPAATPPSPTPQPPLPSPAAAPAIPTPRPQPAAAPVASRTVRWLPLGAIGALVALVVAAIAVATTGDGTAAAPAGPATSATPPPPSSSSAAPVRSLQFALRAAGGDQRCASHAFGDAQASLQQTSCSGVRRASYAATVDGRAGAVTVGIVEFADTAQAAAFKAVADTPGAGGILDLATETGQWGATPVPRFENAAYASKLDGASVRLVQAVWAPGSSTADDPGLVRAAKAALDLPAR
ncbi:hypothetical protein AB0M80_26160 [Amycolatopsis sp. NPDC051045]|uniref:hypothetical protein n=1 Tax=Amycolatopsis sp. NPDC051045 TaxID=3156922 RepID=UPI0034329C16